MHIVALMDKLIAQDKRKEVSERRLAISRFIAIFSIWMKVVSDVTSCYFKGFSFYVRLLTSTKRFHGQMQTKIKIKFIVEICYSRTFIFILSNLFINWKEIFSWSENELLKFFAIILQFKERFDDERLTR